MGGRAGNQRGARASARGSPRYERKRRRVSSLYTLLYTQPKQREFSSTPRFMTGCSLQSSFRAHASPWPTIEALPTRPHQFQVSSLFAPLSICPRHELYHISSNKGLYSRPHLLVVSVPCANPVPPSTPRPHARGSHKQAAATEPR